MADKKRESNFSEEEKKYIIDLVKQHSQVIENKRCDPHIFAKKAETWKTISEELKACGYDRQPKKIKDFYFRIKQNAKTNIYKYKKEIKKTGGGKINVPEPSEIDWAIHEICPVDFKEDISEYDSDCKKRKQREHEFQEEIDGIIDPTTGIIIVDSGIGNHALSPDEMVLLTLRFYATGSFLNAVGDLTGVHKSTASKIIKKVSHAIASLRPIYIKWPTTAEEIVRIRQGFYNIARFPKVMGTIDCTHVKIQSPEMKCRSPTWSEDSGKHSAASVLSESVAGARPVYAVTVKIRKIPGESLGIVFAQGQNESCFPVITSFRARSTAERSDQLAPGDRVRSVNGISTTRIGPDELTVMLDNVIDGTLTFELEYSLPEFSSHDSVSMHTKTTTVTVESVDGSLGLTLRGGPSSSPRVSQTQCSTSALPSSTEPMTVMHVRPGGAAERSGRIKVGDRVLKIDHRNLSNKTLLDAQQLLKQQSSGDSGVVCGLRAHLTALTVEYGVRAAGSMRRGAGALLLQVQRRAQEPLGVGLAYRSSSAPGVYVQSIVPASIADRCGALHVGDQILAVDDTYIVGSLATPQEVTRLLQNSNTNQSCTRLQIMPYHMLVNGQHQGDDDWIHRGPGPPNNKFGTISCYTQSNYSQISEAKCEALTDTLSQGDTASYTDCGQCHVETLTVALVAEPGVGYGLLVAAEGDGDRDGNIVISCVKANTPAYRCGCLQVNDRIVCLNGHYSLTLIEVRKLLELGYTTPGVRLLLQIEFDVANRVISDSGVLDVKLIKSGTDLGITIGASRLNSFFITDIRRGSAAHRTGALQVGDCVLAVDNQRLNHVEWNKIIDDAQNSQSDITTIRIKRTKKLEDHIEAEQIVYTVEITRKGDPLGITVSGSEDGTEPVIVTALMPGGMATKTGALHVGDRILAINDETLGQRPLSDTIRLLRTSGDTVKIRVAIQERNAKEFKSLGNSTECISYDSNLLQLKKTNNMHGNNNTNDNQLLLYSDLEDSLSSSPTSSLYTVKPKVNLGNKYCVQDADTSCEKPVEVHSVTLRKDSACDDFGFSVSDALNEKGVYINRIRRGSPAHLSAMLRPYDRILQVNNTKTIDFDCCHIVPLIASAGNEIHLKISRLSHIDCPYAKDTHTVSWSSEEELSKISLLTKKNTFKKIL